eukprot:3144760-Rhodomonas_salina.3
MVLPWGRVVQGHGTEAGYSGTNAWYWIRIVWYKRMVLSWGCVGTRAAEARRGSPQPPLPPPGPLPPYALAIPSPVLTSRMLVQTARILRPRYAMPGTDLAYGGTSGTRGTWSCYAMIGDADSFGSLEGLCSVMAMQVLASA